MAYTLLVGGVRSGKSTTAERIARASGSSVTVIATGYPGDEEMAARIDEHRRGRDPSWAVVEETIEIQESVESVPSSGFVIVDCLTLWVSNAMEAGIPPDAIVARSSKLAERLRSRPGNGAVVTNEVGWGIVPDNALARAYRDVLGRVNTVMAGEADRTLLLVAGRALELSEVSGV